MVQRFGPSCLLQTRNTWFIGHVGPKFTLDAQCVEEKQYKTAVYINSRLLKDPICCSHCRYIQWWMTPSSTSTHIISYHIISYHNHIISYHISYITYHISHIINHISYVSYHISYIIYHISYITYHISHIIYHISYIISYSLFIMLSN